MHLIFTEEEKEWINKQLFNWTVKKGCPDNIKKTLEKKLQLLAGESNGTKRV